MSKPVRVFISYCHEPRTNRDRVLHLANQLRKDGVDAWIDRYSPAPPEGWARWTSREFGKAEYVLTICTQAYRERFDRDPGQGSGVIWEAGLIRQELYRQGGNHRIIPLILDDDASAIPEELSPYTHYRYPIQYDALLRHITNQPEVLAPPLGSMPSLPSLPTADLLSDGARGDAGPQHWNVPSRPEQYLARAELDKLRSFLLWGGQHTVALSGQHTRFGIQGMPGVGKTVLAVALATDPAVRKAFPGGIFWLTVGRAPEDPVLWQGELAAAAGAKQVELRTSGQGKAELRALFAKRPPSLIILDDVWSIDHADPFNVVAAPSKLLITTRNKEVASGLGAKVCEIAELHPDDALTLLAAYAERPVDELPRAAPAIVRQCGELPLALAMAGSMLRGRPDDRWDGLLEQLQQSNLDHLAAALPDYLQHRSMLAAIKASVDDLPADVRSRFFDVAVCARYGAVPEAVLHRLWKSESAGWTLPTTQRNIDALLDRALIQRASAGHLALHNLQIDYVRASADDIKLRHRRLVAAYRGEAAQAPLHTIPDDGYFFEHIAKHVRDGEGEPALRQLLLDHQWLSAKLTATEPNALLADFELLDLEKDQTLRLLRDALRLSAHVVGPRPHELPSQILGRLRGLPEAELRDLCARIEDASPPLTLCPLWPSLTPPGSTLLCTMEGHQGVIHAVALTTDGKTVVSGSEDGTLKVWNVAAGKALRTLEGHQGAVNSVALSRDTRVAVSASTDQTLRVWEVATGKTLRVLRGHRRPVQAVALSGDGKLAVSGSGDRTVKVWDVSTGEVIRTMEGHQGSVRAVALGSDGRTVVSGSKDKTLRVWDLTTGEALCTLAGHSGWVLSVAMSRDMRTVLSGSDDGTIRLWDIAGSKQVGTLEGHDQWVLALALSQDGRTAISGGSDQTLRLWDIETRRCLRILRDYENWISAVALSSDGKTVVSGSSGIKVWNATGEDRPLDKQLVHIEEVALSADGKTAAIAPEAAILEVLDGATGSVVRELDGHRGWLRAVALSQDGTIAVSGSDDATLRVWEVATGKTLWTLEGHQGWVQAVALSGDGKTIVSGSTDQTLKIWDATTGGARRTLEGHTGSVQALALSGDGKTAVSGSTEPVVLVWDVAEGRLMRTLDGHQGSVLAVALNHDGTIAVSGSTDRTVKVWDVAKGRVLRTLEGHQGWVQDVVLSADGKTVLSGSTDKTLRVWDVRSEALVGSFTVESALTSFAIDSSGRLLASDAIGHLHRMALRLPR